MEELEFRARQPDSKSHNCLLESHWCIPQGPCKAVTGVPLLSSPCPPPFSLESRGEKRFSSPARLFITSLSECGSRFRLSLLIRVCDLSAGQAEGPPLGSLALLCAAHSPKCRSWAVCALQDPRALCSGWLKSCSETWQESEGVTGQRPVSVLGQEPHLEAGMEGLHLAPRPQDVAMCL